MTQRIASAFRSCVDCEQASTYNQHLVTSRSQSSSANLNHVVLTETGGRPYRPGPDGNWRGQTEDDLGVPSVPAAPLPARQTPGRVIGRSPSDGPARQTNELQTAAGRQKTSPVWSEGPVWSVESPGRHRAIDRQTLLPTADTGEYRGPEEV